MSKETLEDFTVRLSSSVARRLRFLGAEFERSPEACIAEATVEYVNSGLEGGINYTSDSEAQKDAVMVANECPQGAEVAK